MPYLIFSFSKSLYYFFPEKQSQYSVYLSIYIYLLYIYRERARRYLLLELAQAIMETKSHSLLSAIENQENQCYDWILF